MNTNRSANHLPVEDIAGAPFRPIYVDVVDDHVYTPGRSQTQYHIVVKRNDMLYRVLNFINTMFSILGVLMIVATFVMVCYSVVVLSQVVDVVEVIRTQQIP